METVDPSETNDLTAEQQIRIASLNAAIAIGITHPQKACQMAEKFSDWIAFGMLPHPAPGETW